MEKQTVNGFNEEIRESSAWDMVNFMFTHKYASEGDFDTMNETLRRCGEHLNNLEGEDGEGWDNENGSMTFYTAKGRREFAKYEFVQLMFDAKVLDYFAKNYLGTNEAYADGFY